MDDCWLYLDRDKLLDSIIGQLENGVADEDDIVLLSRYIKHIVKAEKLVVKEKDWLKKFSVELNFRLLSCVDLLHNQEQKDLFKKVLIEIMKTISSIDGITEPLLEICHQKLTKSVHILSESFHELSQGDFSQVENILNLLQITLNTSKGPSSTSSGDLLKICNEILLTEWVSDKQFVMANHIIFQCLDTTKEDQIDALLLSIRILHQRKNYSTLFLFLAMQLEKLVTSNLIEKEFFWNLLQDGLVCSDPLARKRSLYIIKCILDVISQKNSFSTDLTGNAVSPIVLWQNNKADGLWKAWKTFVLLSETLEEKQVHVINPVLVTAKDLLEISKVTEFHYSWLLVILQRAMAHESKIIQTWAVKFSLCLDLSKFPLLSQHKHHFVFDVLFESLKNIFLYNIEDDAEPGSPPKLLLLLKSFFKSCFHVLDKCQQSEFCTKILQTISSSTFNQIALVYITMALSEQLLTSKLNEKHMEGFLNFLMNKIPVYNKEFQIIIFHNLAVFYCRNLEPSHRIMEMALSILSNAYTVDIMKFGTKCWMIWKQYFADAGTTTIKEILHNKLSDYMSPSTKMIDIVTKCTEVFVLVEILMDSNGQIGTELADIFQTVSKLRTNPYTSNEKILKCLQFVNLQVNKKTTANEFDIVQEKLFGQLVQDLLVFPVVKDNDNESIWILWLGIMTGLVSHSHKGSNGNVIAKFFKDTAQSLTNFSDTQKMIFLAKLKLLSLGIEFIKNTSPQDDLFSKLLALVTNFDRKKLAKLETTLNCDTFISSSWVSLKSIMNCSLISSEQSDAMFSAFLMDITMASNDTIIILTDFAKQFVHLFKDDESKLCELIDCMWRIVETHIRDGQGLWPIYKKCIEAILHKNVLCSSREVIINKVKQQWENIFDLGERKMAVTTIAVEQFFKVWSMDDTDKACLKNYVDILVQIATFGPLRQKKEKPLHHLYTFLNTNEQFDSVDMLKSFQQYDQQVRVTFINFVLHLANTGEMEKLVSQLIHALLTFDQNVTKKCYYANSLVHRQKLRCWQAFLLSLPKLPKDFDFQGLLPKLFISCKADNQVSVRYLIEWAIVLVLNIDRSLLTVLLEEFNSSSEKKIFSVTYIISTLLQLIKTVTDEEFRQLTSKAVPSILPWAHAQHMTSRIHSQLALELIWQRIQREHNKELREKFYFLEYFFSLTEKNSASVKHRKGLTETFYFSKFDALKDYNLESMFYIFLKNHAILADEWIFYGSFTLPKHFQTNFPELMVKLRREDVSKEERMSLPKVETVEVEDQIYVDTQKKIMPWNLVPTDDLLLQSELSRKRDFGTSELILCAVLVDKIPNLGGLSRTAEIFGAKKLLIGSNRYLSDPSFKSLSVTSEKWLDIEQVIPIKLASYLSEMREEGYTIVGVEQTANSKMIGEFNFPKKSILVLGNEKTGIPVDLIQLLDECVEIPQFGIIRSLNVHISGAIMIWEYCKQHSL